MEEKSDRTELFMFLTTCVRGHINDGQYELGELHNLGVQSYR